MIRQNRFVQCVCVALMTTIIYNWFSITKYYIFDKMRLQNDKVQHFGITL